MNPDGVSQAMLKLESLAELDPVMACILMAHLWPIADGLLMHHVCDAIDLWIARCNSPVLTDQLQLIVGCEKDADVRRHHETFWLGPR
jgi:hypothetical protein